MESVEIFCYCREFCGKPSRKRTNNIIEKEKGKWMEKGTQKNLMTKLIFSSGYLLMVFQMMLSVCDSVAKQKYMVMTIVLWLFVLNFFISFFFQQNLLLFSVEYIHCVYYSAFNRHLKLLLPLLLLSFAF